MLCIVESNEGFTTRKMKFDKKLRDGWGQWVANVTLVRRSNWKLKNEFVVRMRKLIQIQMN